MMNIYIAGEDEVTTTIVEKLLNFCFDNYSIIEKIPARGGKIKSSISQYNKLAEYAPVILALDLDNADCAPSLIKLLLKGEKQHPNFILRIAVDEDEVWLMSDRDRKCHASLI